MISERSLKQWQGGEREQGKALRESWGHDTFLGWLLLPRDPYKLAGLSEGMTAQSYARLPGKVLKVPSTPWRGKEHRQESAVSLTTPGCLCSAPLHVVALSLSAATREGKARRCPCPIQVQKRRKMASVETARRKTRRQTVKGILRR